MLFEPLLMPFLQKRPVAVMVRACFECAFAHSQIDALFDRVATTQYHHRLAFSSMVELLGKVVTRRASSVHTAYRAEPSRLGVSLSSVYDKLQHTEPALSEALVRFTAEQLGAVVQSWPQAPQPFPGLKLKILDGNYLAGTDHRLKPIRQRGAAALPGMAVVIQDHGTRLVTDVLVQPDAYTNERALIGRLLPRFGIHDVVVADRNFCVEEFLEGLTHQEAFFVIRHHLGMQLRNPSEERSCGVGSTGAIFESSAQVGTRRYRVIRIQRKVPTRDGDTEIRVLTNLPENGATAEQVAESYRLRWTIEATFLELTRSVIGELPGLGHPHAALFAFSLALCACNAVRVAERALELSQGAAHPGESVSSYFVVNELVAAYDGIEVMFPEQVWEQMSLMSPSEMGVWLLRIASTAEWSKYRKSKRGEKTPQAKIPGKKGSPHISTYRMLEEYRKRCQEAKRMREEEDRKQREESRRTQTV